MIQSCYCSYERWSGHTRAWGRWRLRSTGRTSWSAWARMTRRTSTSWVSAWSPPSSTTEPPTSSPGTTSMAMTTLTSHQMLNLEEERDLVGPISDSSRRKEFSQLLAHLYWGSLKRYSDDKVQFPLNILDNAKWTTALRDNSDMRVSDLERLYYNYDYHAAI